MHYSYINKKTQLLGLQILAGARIVCGEGHRSGHLRLGRHLDAIKGRRASAQGRQGSSCDVPAQGSTGRDTASPGTRLSATCFVQHKSDSRDCDRLGRETSDGDRCLSAVLP